jgi:hypothetical protein
MPAPLQNPGPKSPNESDRQRFLVGGLNLLLNWSVRFRAFAFPVLRAAKDGDFEFVFNWLQVADL